MALDPLELQDCNNIAKTFEKSCHHCLTEESVFAVMTPMLSSMRSMSKTIQGVADRQQTKPVKQDQTKASTDLNALSSNDAESPSTKVSPAVQASTATTSGSSIDRAKKELASIVGMEGTGGLFNNECIPCGFRINFADELNNKAFNNRVGQEFWETIQRWLELALNQLLQLIDMFRNLDKYIDLCSFLKFLKDFVCIPDFQKMLGLLAAYLMKLAGELNLSFDLILSLVAPLFMPFFTNLVETLNKFLLMIIKPIECIIDAIQNLLGKLDYNVLFQQFQNVDISLGPKQGKPSSPTKVPLLNVVAQDPNAPERDTRKRAFEASLSAPFDAQRAKEQAQVEKAAKELQVIRQGAGNVDASDPESVQDYKEKEAAARENYDNAVKDRNLSEIGKANQNIESFQKGFKSAFFSLINVLREAAAELEAFIHGLLDEFKKLISEYAGGSGNTVFLLNRKLEILQLIAMIKALMDVVKKGFPKCNSDAEEVGIVLNNLAKDQNFKVWTDEDGKVNIESDDADVSDALGDLAGASSQKPEGLVEFTGDPTLDSKIAKAVDGLTRPSRVQFECAARTSPEQAEQVNKWIQELNSV